MKFNTLLVLFILIQSCLCFGQAVLFPDSVKTAKFYYSPYIKPDVFHKILGVVEIGEPLDSLDRKRISYNKRDDSPDSFPKANFIGDDKLLIIVDTSQEVDLPISFYESFRDDDGFYLSPRAVHMLDFNKKTILPLTSDTTIKFKGTPIYILNNTSHNAAVATNGMNGVSMVQQVLNKRGTWVDIERFATGIGHHIIRVNILQPQQMMIGVVPKYKGSFQTLARVKFSSSERVYYSQPYKISINPSIFLRRKTAIIDDSLFEK